jgi:DNA topoisomerase-1
MSSTIIITEKPDAMERIAKALAESNLIKRTSKYGVDYYEFFRDGKNFIAVCAVGHLFNLKQKGKGSDYPVFDAEWVPSCMAVKKAFFSMKYFDTLEWSAQRDGDSELIAACDFDNEGSLIAEKIIKLIFKKEDGKRMKFSTLTKQDLINAYENMMPHLDVSNITAGETRHYLDWMYGINTSRALTLSIKKVSKKFSLLTAGRVQAPTLIILADRELEIKNFVPTPYWQLQLVLLVDGSEVIAFFEEDKIWDKDKADRIFNECKGKPAVVESIKTKRYKQYPPTPFNITSLQTEAYRLFGYSPQQTMSIAQSLYTKAYISYPRTSSEKLPPQIGYKQILEALSKFEDYNSMCKALLSNELKPVEGKLIDSAHESIHPTVEPPENVKKLNFHEQRIYDLICRRFFSVFAQPAIRESVQVLINVNNHNFLADGRRTIERGWMDFYKPYYRPDDIFLPNIKKGDILNVKSLEILNKKTSPHPRYSQASIIKEMEKRGLGTRATRSAILQTLYDRDYITGRTIQVSELGIKISDVIKKYVPDFADEKLTKRFEKGLEKIVEGKDEKEKILKRAKKAIIKVSKEFKQNEDKIGKELEEAIVKTQDEKSILGKCSSCGKDLKIIFSPKTRKYFVGCTGYKEGCKTIYPLPHSATIYKTSKICEKCKTPIIKVYRRGRRPFSMCLDPKCETKADWGKPKKSTP